MAKRFVWAVLYFCCGEPSAMSLAANLMRSMRSHGVHYNAGCSVVAGSCWKVSCIYPRHSTSSSSRSFMATVYYETGRHLIAASIALAVVDVIAVATKFWVRLSFKQSLLADDWLLVPATVRTTSTFLPTHIIVLLRRLLTRPS